MRILKSYILIFVFSMGGVLFAQAKEGEAKPDKFTDAYKEADEAVERNRVTNSFFALGATIGEPASLNAHAAFYMWRFIVRGSGMFYGPNAMGIQGDLGFSFLNGARVRHSVSFVAGYARRNPLFVGLDPNFPNDKTAVLQTGTYLGVAYELFMDGFFVQAGVGNNMGGEMKSPILIFQAGYLFAFAL